MKQKQDTVRQNKEAINDEKVKAAMAVAAVRKQSVASSLEMKRQLKQKDEMMAGYHQLAEDVSLEYAALKRAAKAETSVLVKTANARLESLKKSKAQESLLRDNLDNYYDDLITANEKIAMLEKMLGEQVDTVAGLKDEVGQAQEKITVSPQFFFTRLHGNISHMHYFIQALTPWTLEKSGNPKMWDERVTQLVVELLSHRTPPSSVSANILSVVELLLPNSSIVKELPSIRFVRYCRTILAHVSQTLAAYEIALADNIEQSHTDGTSRRQTAMQNFVVRVLQDGGSRRITLSSCILAEDKSAVSIAAAIVKEFKHSGELLTQWRDVVADLYPGRHDLLDKIPDASKLSISKLGFGSFTTTDTCSAARKLQLVLKEHIKKVALEEGYSDEAIVNYEADCWQHLRNVWIGAVTLSLEMNYLMCWQMT